MIYQLIFSRISRVNIARKNFLDSISNVHISNRFFQQQRRTEINLSHRNRLVNKQINLKHENETKKYFIYGTIAICSVIFLYIYERWSGRAKLLKDDNLGDNLISESNSKEEPKPSISGKYSSFNFFADIVDQASPSVVFIQVQDRNPFFPMNANISCGSGFLVDKDDGIILTNAHVIANFQQVVVQFNDGRTLNGVVEFVDERLDLATVRVSLAHIQDLKPIQLGDSKQTRAGEWVIAVGSPFSLSNTVTVGVISSISRAGRVLGIRDNIEYIQTDASINVGNSGGPLLNLDGQAIGINTLKAGEGISFAIPSFYAEEFLKKCKKFRNQQALNNRNYIDSSSISDANAPVPNRGVYLGFTIVTLTPNLIESHRIHDPNFPPDVQNGVMIYRIVLGAPAHLCGFESGDIIVAINGNPVQTADEVYRIIQMECSKAEMIFSVKRGRANLDLKVRPGIGQ